MSVSMASRGPWSAGSPARRIRRQRRSTSPTSDESQQQCPRLDRARRDALHVGFGDDNQRLLVMAARLQLAREVATRGQLGGGQLERADPRIPRLRSEFHLLLGAELMVRLVATEQGVGVQAVEQAGPREQGTVRSRPAHAWADVDEAPVVLGDGHLTLARVYLHSCPGNAGPPPSAPAGVARAAPGCR